MVRIIILEGTDTAGKTTLANVLQDKFNLPLHERFVKSSAEGPIDDLATKTFRDIKTIHTQPLSIYDRHPMLSEYAYATAIPERIVKDDFLEAWAMNMLTQFARASLVIFCIPPYQVIRHELLSCQACKHVHTSITTTPNICLYIMPNEELCECTTFVYREEMPGVVENIAAIYQMYRLLHVFWPEPQRAILYDYTKPESIKRVLSRCQIHISEWKKAHPDVWLL